MPQEFLCVTHRAILCDGLRWKTKKGAQRHLVSSDNQIFSCTRWRLVPSKVEEENADTMPRLLRYPHRQLIQLLECRHTPPRKGHNTLKHNMQHNLHRTKNMTVVVGATFVTRSGELLVRPTPTSSRHLCHCSVGYIVTKLLGGNVGG
jgi:hypothetical protein